MRRYAIHSANQPILLVSSNPTWLLIDQNKRMSVCVLLPSVTAYCYSFVLFLNAHMSFVSRTQTLPISAKGVKNKNPQASFN